MNKEFDLRIYMLSVLKSTFSGYDSRLVALYRRPVAQMLQYRRYVDKLDVLAVVYILCCYCETRDTWRMPWKCMECRSRDTGKKLVRRLAWLSPAQKHTHHTGRLLKN